jgi:hypothetical protein
MNREEAFETLWNKLKDMGGFDPSREQCNSWLLYKDDVTNTCIHLNRNGDYYKYQVYIGASGFTTIDISVLLENIEDHNWCWDMLSDIGIEKSLLGVE